jgi:YidC/Oxa1 family membrane protein insertase
MFALMSPIMSIWFGYMWPAAMSIYWIANSAFRILQDYLLTIHYRRVFADKDAVNQQKEADEKEAAAQKKAELSAKREANAQLNRSNTSQKKYKQLKSQMQPTRPKQTDSSGNAGEKKSPAREDESKGASDNE